jgi:urea transport system substrate-binding protein
MVPNKPSSGIPQDRNITRRQFLERTGRGMALTTLGTGMIGALAACEKSLGLESSAPIPVGILHSLTGTMALSEQPVVNSTLMAIEEINARGGVLGRQLKPILADGASDWPTFAKLARRLIQEDEVAVVFGCWTSASRRTVKPVFEELRHLLFYPVQYEGLEQSPNIVYTGAAPNQQITPAVTWAVNNLGKRRLFLVGSDYVFPRSANAIICDVARGLGVDVMGEVYVPLGGRDMTAVMGKILESKPDVILNTINGDSNLTLFPALRASGIRTADVPTISFSIAEPELKTLPSADVAGDYACWNYFQSTAGVDNTRFVQNFQRKYGADQVVSDPLEAAYFGVKIWARAAEEARSIQPLEILATVRDMGEAAPGGMVYIDPENLHTWKTVRIGKILPDAQFEEVWNSGRPVRPVPYPITRQRAAWDHFLADMQRGWGGAWAAPPVPAADPTVQAI